MSQNIVLLRRSNIITIIQRVELFLHSQLYRKPTFGPDLLLGSWIKTRLLGMSRHVKHTLGRSQRTRTYLQPVHHYNRIYDWWSQTKARHEEDISVTLDLCHNQALDGNHYDEESHTCKFK